MFTRNRSHGRSLAITVLVVAGAVLPPLALAAGDSPRVTQSLDENWRFHLGEVPGAVVYSEKGGVDKESLCAFLSEQIAQFKLPAYVWFTEQPLPKLGTGKIDKVSLREAYRKQATA